MRCSCGGLSYSHLYVRTVQERITALLRLADDAAASMNNELRVQLVKIPKQVFRASEPAADIHDTVHNCTMLPLHWMWWQRPSATDFQPSNGHFMGSSKILSADSIDETVRLPGKT